METNNGTVVREEGTRRISVAEIGDRLATSAAGRDRPLLVYLHVPFCNSKCIFCDWVTPISPKQLRSTLSVRERYADALSTQVRAVGPMLMAKGYKPRLVYWGGGTPTKLESDDFQKIMTALSEAFDLSQVQEHTLEASPETLTPAKLETLRKLGGNRLSIGAQSMDDEELRDIGRAHSSRQIREAFAMARAAGFSNINIDLIVGFPGQSVDKVVRSLQSTLALEPDHVTVYPYRPSPGTVMSQQIIKGSRVRGSLKETLDCYNVATLMLKDAGYDEYCLGYFAHEEQYRCRAEEYYFGLLGDYVGLGSGARSILGQQMIASSPTDLHGFIEHPAGFDSCVAHSPSRLENILPSLRLALFDAGGINFERFRDTFGFEFAELLKDPLVRALLDYLRLCGTEFVQTGHSLAASDESRARGYIMSLLRAFVPMKANEVKVNDAFAYVDQRTALPAQS